MIRFVAYLLRGWWWVYYAAWNAGEFIVCHLGWLTRHTFQMLVFVNAPLAINILVGGLGTQDQAYDPHGPAPDFAHMADVMVSLVAFIFWIDKIVIVGLVAIWVFHVTISLFAKE